MVGLKAVSSTVIFETAKDTQQDYQRMTVYLIFLFWSIMYNGFDWYDLSLEVREMRSHRIDVLDAYYPCMAWDYYAGNYPGNSAAMVTPGDPDNRGSSYGGRGDYGCGGYATSSRNFAYQDLYKDYSGPDQQVGGYSKAYVGCPGGYGGVVC